MKYKAFQHTSIESLKQELDALGEILPLAEDVSILREPLPLRSRDTARTYPVIANRLAIQPMEGCDGTQSGEPGPLTLRRYDRFAQSGAGLIWVEAVAIVPEGRANSRQLQLTEDNLSDYQRLVETIKQSTYSQFGFEPVLVMQATHSGRYAKQDQPRPMVMQQNLLLQRGELLPEAAIVTDDYLKALPEKYASSAKLAEKAGFDGVDIKACHRYLISESFSAYDRPGPYGGEPFENRTRLFRSALQAARAALSSRVFVTSRMNIYDGYPYPYGMGVMPERGVEPVLDEAIAIVRMLREEFDAPIVDLTLGNPYFNPHVNRPFDQGPYKSDEHPLTGVARANHCIGTIKAAVPEIAVLSSALTYLRTLSGYLAAGQIREGVADMAGFGRQAFAYPTFAADLLQTGKLDPRKICITCSKCSQLMRANTVAGCVVRDPEYLPIYRKALS